MLLKSIACQSDCVFRVLNPVSGGNSSYRFDRDMGLLHGPGPFTCSGFNLYLQFGADLAAHIAALCDDDPFAPGEFLTHQSLIGFGRI